MPATAAQLATAQTQQHQAAHDLTQAVRQVAGPGTGKSMTIGERVSWLLHHGVAPHQIFVVSFTRASARDLEAGIKKYFLRQGVVYPQDIHVSTLHSLALGALRRAGLLGRFPADPLVLGDAELQQFDAEIGVALNVTPKRASEIRLDHEAYWQTGLFNPPNYATPNPPISPQERATFTPLHRERTGLYACVLPGEIVRTCLQEAQAGVFNPVPLLGMRHLIVDEYQDLNPCDVEFIDWIAGQGVNVFVAGDDDQSIYSFRYASPQGIQGFIGRHPNATTHSLDQCFRCTPTVLSAAQALIQAYAPANRLPKNLTSIYSSTMPTVSGLVRGWRFSSGTTEAQAIAESCRDLIAAGIPAEEIMVLISNRDVLQRGLLQAFDQSGVLVDHAATGLSGSKLGAFVLAMLRIVCSRDDYVAHRTILGALVGVGPGTCNRIAAISVQANLNFRDLFYNRIPPNVFGTRESAALKSAGLLCHTLSHWQGGDTLAQRLVDIANVLVQNNFGVAIAEWQAFVATLPMQATLQELRDYLWATTEEERYRVLTSIEDRLGLPATAPAVTGRVRLLTMHGAKGLSAQVVFIPGLEEQVLPGARRQASPGLIQEAARLLYVSITRARVACILSWSTGRVVNGQFTRQAGSQFNAQLGIRFGYVTSGLQPVEIGQIINDWRNL